MLIRDLWRDRDFWLPHSDAAFLEEKSLGESPDVYGLSSDHIAAKRLGNHSISLSKGLN